MKAENVFRCRKKAQLVIRTENSNGFCIVHIERDGNGKSCDLTFLQANAVFAAESGKTVDEIIGHRFSELYPDRKCVQLTDRLEDAVNGECIGLDEIYPGRDCGVHVDVYPTCKPDCLACVLIRIDDDGKYAGDADRQNLHDMIEKFEEEQKIYGETREYAQSVGIVYETSIKMDYTADSYHIIIYDNLFGRTAPEKGNIDALIRESASKMPDPDEKKIFLMTFGRKSVIEAFKSGKKRIYLRYRRYGEDGEIHWMYSAAICTECDENGIKGITMTRCIDEEMKRVERDARAERDAATINAIGRLYSVIIEVDIPTHKIRVVKSKNFIENILDGHRHGVLDDVIAKSMDTFVSSESKDEMREFLDLSTLADRLDGSESVSVEYTDVSGRWLKARFLAKERDDNGRAVVALYIARDISFEKAKEVTYLEQIRAKAAEADRANLSKTNFLRRMSHDIRTPLNGIMGMLKIMDANEGDKVKYREYMDKVRRSADYLISIVNNVLDIGKMETGNIELEHRPFDLESLLLNTIPIIETNAAQNSVIYKGGADDMKIVHRYVVGSPVHLNRILMNIASNAIKYNRTGGSLSVSCSELRCDGDQATYEFVCADSGLGMSEEFQRKAFEAFTQEGKPTTTGFAGSGLGLSIVKKIVDSMGGSVEIKSKENVGTVVRMVLTLDLDKNPEDSRSREEEMANLDLSGRRAMLVEDNEINMEIATVLLGSMGLEIVGVTNGKEALDLFAESEPYTFDFIFMDMMMPVMDGLEATRRIRALPNEDAKTVSIIAMTANAFAEDRKACLDAGMNDHIGKPINGDELARVLKMQIDRR